jgi:hypothetical protein
MITLPPRTIAVVGTLVGLLGIYAYIGSARLDAQDFFSSERRSYAESETFWEGSLRTNAMESTSEQFAALENIDPAYGHEIAHALGEALYNTEGYEGIAACGPQFLYGCYHQLLGIALAKEGRAILPAVDAACKKKPVSERFSCNHGVGHGMIGMSGYERVGLSQALSECESLDASDPRQPCMDGVFMEYNMRELAATNSNNLANVRPYETARRYDPCDTLERTYQKACYFELPPWWMSSDSGAQSIDERVGLAAKNCMDIRNQDMKNFCVFGFGHSIAPTASFNTDTVMHFCGMLQDTARITDCLAAAARRATIERVPGNETWCDVFRLEGDDLSKCREYVRVGRT